MQDITEQIRLRQWARQIDDWRASGMTQKNWCRIHGIGYEAFKYRKAKVEKCAAELMQNENRQIVAIDAALVSQEQADHPQEPDQTLEIHLQKATIRVSNHIDVLLLKCALEVLKDA